MSAKATSRAHAGLAAVLGIILVGLTAPPARAQSLADIARKEEERRKTLAAPAKVYTNKDLHAVPGDSPNASAPAPGKPADDAPKAADGDGKGNGPKTANADDKAPGKDQKYWAGRLKALQDKLARDQDYADAMQTRINALTTDFVNRD